MGSSRLCRLICLLGQIQAGYGASVEYLAEVLGCSARTVFRDLKLLNDNGLAVHFNPELGRYTVSDQLPKLSSALSESEYASLLIAASASPLRGAPGIGTAVDQGVSKLLNSAPPTVRNRVNRAVRALVLDDAWQRCITDDDLAHLEIVFESVQQRHYLRFHWQDSASGQPLSTKLAVFQLVADNDQLFLIGRSTYHRAVVKLRLRSVVRLEQLVGETYDVPVEYMQGGVTGAAKMRHRLATRMDGLPMVG